MFLHVVRVDCIAPYRLRIHFSDQIVKDVDLSQELYGEVFEPSVFVKATRERDHGRRSPGGADGRGTEEVSEGVP